MDPKDLPPLRSGLGRLGGQLVEPGHTDASSTCKRLISAVVVMTRRAAEQACTWSQHNGRDAANASDIEIALKHQARHFLGTLDDPDVVTEILDAEREIFGSDDEVSEEDDSESGDEEDDSEADESGDEPAAASDPTHAVPKHCTCDLCDEMRAAYDTWGTWVPEDEIEQYLKSRVDIAVKSTGTSRILCLEMEI
jgi:hypothetical protein